MLKEYIKDRLKEKDILLMTHIVIGYPSFEESFEIIRQMVDAGVEFLTEAQARVYMNDPASPFYPNDLP